ncbi:MAG: sulfite exporter TauE/SafE family protein [Leptospira sp.]|nr:sulfite exporter TauE/SafE family protein [Leptospira sp.]
MNIHTVIALISIGLFAGALGGLLGIGGAMVLIPAMVFFLGLNQHEAIGTSLAVMLPPIGLFAAYNYYKAGYVNIKFAMILAIAFMMGSFFTSKIAINIPENIVRKIFSIIFLLISVKMFFSK